MGRLEVLFALWGEWGESESGGCGVEELADCNRNAVDHGRTLFIS